MVSWRFDSLGSICLSNLGPAAWHLAQASAGQYRSPPGLIAICATSYGLVEQGLVGDLLTHTSHARQQACPYCYRCRSPFASR